ncbi:MAG: serine/threonine protein kinase, partial [Burkholderiales bacterium]|nr:serine/threonine protein kinase [Anaerolineae bacterium]
MSQQTTIAGRYEIAALIGQGGMGAVYRALDTKTGETVAIKSLKSEVVEGNPDLVERFTREAEVLRRLNHPSIVAILDAIEDNNQYHIIMEYVSGGSLRDLLRKQGQLPVARVLEIALDLADALTRTHRLKIIHRDIKPANVLLAEDGTPRLTDFGVAHLDDLSRVTQTGSVIGTYAYLSPEACNGELQDERADIWSFGVVLFEMLAGKNPFDQGSPAQTLMAILNSLVPTLSEFRPDVPPSLEVLINRMLSKSKEDRIDSVRQVGAELEAILRSLDTQARANVRDILPATSGSRFTSATPTPAALPFSAEPDESRTPEATPSTKTPFSDATPNS